MVYRKHKLTKTQVDNLLTFDLRKHEVVAGLCGFMYAELKIQGFDIDAEKLVLTMLVYPIIVRRLLAEVEIVDG